MDFANIKETYKNHNSKWIIEDTNKVYDMIKNKTILNDDIALDFGRTYNAVKLKILHILYEYYNKNENDINIDNGLTCIHMNKETFMLKYNLDKTKKTSKTNKEINKSDKDQNKTKTNKEIIKIDTDQNKTKTNKEINKIDTDQNKTKTLQDQIEELNQKMDLILKKLDSIDFE